MSQLGPIAALAVTSVIKILRHLLKAGYGIRGARHRLFDDERHISIIGLFDRRQDALLNPDG
jgi:hypothetical protein